MTDTIFQLATCSQHANMRLEPIWIESFRNIQQELSGASSDEVGNGEENPDSLSL